MYIFHGNDTCVGVHCPDETRLSKPDLFACNLLWLVHEVSVALSRNCFTSWKITYQQNSFHIPENLCHNLSGRLYCLCFLCRWRINMFPTALTLFCLWGVVANPCFICGHKLAQKILLVSLKMHILQAFSLSCIFDPASTVPAPICR